MTTGAEQAEFPAAVIVSAMMALAFNFVVHSVSAAENQYEIDKCIQERMLLAGNSVTIGQLRERCQKQLADTGEHTRETNVQRRLRLEKSTLDNPYVISAHKPNYLLLAASNDDTNEAPFATQFPSEDTSLEDTEVKFQISVKFPIAVDLFERIGDVSFAYTNRSFWQMYNDNSRPFRETNHEPEVFLTLKNDWELLGFRNTFVNIGISHQSNGRGATLSRSWNRFYTSFILEKNNLILAFKPWYRIPENKLKDDNPDIEDFMGNFELAAVYKRRKNTFSAMLRNTLESEHSRGAVQVDWIFRLNRHTNGYLQYFNGYGESLVDYNYDQQSIGFGIALTGWI